MEIVKVCQKHGDLIADQVSFQKKGKRCKQCKKESSMKEYHKILTSEEIDFKLKSKVCSIHGKLTRENTVITGTRIRCHQCKLDSLKATYDKHKDKYAEKFRLERRDKVNATLKEKRQANLEKYREYERTKYHRNKEKASAGERGRKFNITLEQYQKMLDEQQNRCAICNNYETRRLPGSNECAQLCIDHNHVTGKIRKLLCHKCNVFIGMANESIYLLQSAIAYLNKHKPE